jgi:uncharacterized protein (DUF433 family)
MSTVTLSKTTFQWLLRTAQESARTPDQVVDEILRQQLAPKHAYIEVVEKITGSQAIIRGTRIPVSIIIGYLRLGEAPESLVEKILPHLTLAEVYDALSYYHDHRDDIEQELLENTEEHGRAYLREHLGEAGYLRRGLRSVSSPLQSWQHEGAAVETERVRERVDTELLRMPFPRQDTKGDETAGHMMPLGPRRAGLTAAQPELRLAEPDDCRDVSVTTPTTLDLVVQTPVYPRKRARRTRSRP